jgi:hypothetical protein
MSYTDLFIDQGADFLNSLTLDADDGSAINVAGYSFTCQLRTSYYTANATANIVVSISDAANGVVLMTLDAANTSNIYAARYVYDVLMTDTSNTKTRILNGIMTVTPGVSGGFNQVT